MSGALTVMISPQIEADVRDLVGSFFAPIQIYASRYRVLPNEIGAAGNCRIVVNAAGMTSVRDVKAVIWEATPTLGLVSEIEGLLSPRKPRWPRRSVLASWVYGLGRSLGV